MGPLALRCILTCVLKFLVPPRIPVRKHTEAGSLRLRVVPSFETGGKPDLPYFWSYATLPPISLVAVLR